MECGQYLFSEPKTSTISLPVAIAIPQASSPLCLINILGSKTFESHPNLSVLQLKTNVPTDFNVYREVVQKNKLIQKIMEVLKTIFKVIFIKLFIVC